MKTRWFLAAIILLLPRAGDVWAQTEFFRLEDLRPGMKGIGKTCYMGSRPEEFQVEILGIMRRVSPGADAVLARLSGGPLLQTGVFEGMSGSPVFIDGKLLGAVAFSFAFAKEAIAGITPIAQMVEAFTEGPNLEGAGSRTILKKSALWNYQLPSSAELPQAPRMEITTVDARLQPALAPFAGHALQPIATPLSLAGVSAETIRMFAPRFRNLGFSLLQGAGAAGLQAAGSAPNASLLPDNSDLEPGSNLIIPLVQGDMDFSAGGTVTYISGNKLYAFGHALFNLGFSQLPMYKGRAITVFPSLQSSFKILETTDPVGVVRQDRGLGVFGILGEKARMIPLRININTSRGIKRVWNFQLVQDRLLTALLINLTVFETINSTERAMGISTLRVKGKIRLKGQQPIEVENRFSSEGSSSANAALSIAAPVNFLLSSGYKGLELENIELDVSSLEEDRSALLDALRVDRSEARPGDTVGLDIFYKKANGEILRDSYPVRIPSNIAPGPLSLLIADGTTFMAMDAQEQGEDLIPRNLEQLVQFINNLRKNDRLYLRMFRREPGAIVNGEGFPGLPPSILSILRSERSTGSMTQIQTMPLLEYELSAGEYIVGGSKVLNLTIKP